MLYGQRFVFYEVEALARSLARLRPETLGLLRIIGWKFSTYDRTHRPQEVMPYLAHAPMLRRMWINIPSEIYEGRKLRDWRRLLNVAHNRAAFTKNQDEFRTQVSRYLAFCPYRSHFGLWMCQVYREGGIDKPARTLVVRQSCVRDLWCYMLTGSREGWALSWKAVECSMSPNFWEAFSKALFAELDILLSQRQQREDTQQGNHLLIGRRTTRNSWLSLDLAVELPGFDLQLPGLSSKITSIPGFRAFVRGIGDHSARKGKGIGMGGGIFSRCPESRCDGEHSPEADKNKPPITRATTSQWYGFHLPPIATLSTILLIILALVRGKSFFFFWFF